MLTAKAFAVTLVATGVLGGTIGWAADTQPLAAQLVAAVAERLEPVVRAFKQPGVDLSQVRIDYLLATEGSLKENAAVSRRPYEGEPGVTVCLAQHPLVPRPDGTPEPAEWLDVTMLVGVGIAEDLCELQPVRVAVIMGHEFGHLVLGHLGSDVGKGDTLMQATLTREREFAADQAGVEFAEQAGYPNAVAAATDCWLRMTQLYGNTSPLEPKTAFRDHPTNLERAAELQRDAQRHEQWRAALTFENGVTYLQLGEWGPAQACFAEVLRRFPVNPDTLTNLGYAKMMAFYAGLPVAERRKLGGEISCLSFATARPIIRGGTETDKTPLREAVTHYRTALNVAPDCLPALTSLGAGLLLDPDSTPAALQEAVGVLERVVKAAGTGSANRDLLCDASANLALARVRLAGAKDPVKEYGQALSFLQSRATVPAALKANYAAALVQSPGRTDWEQADQLLTEYLSRTPPESYYYQAAALDWLRARKALGLATDRVPTPAKVSWLPGTHVTLPEGGEVFTQEPWAVARAALGQRAVVLTPADERAPNFTCACPELGLTLRVSRGVVRAIILDSANAPTVALRSDRQGQGPKLVLQVGQPLVTPAALGLMTDPVTIGSDRYKLYRQVGVALRCDADSRILGIALISG